MAVEYENIQVVQLLLEHEKIDLNHYCVFSYYQLWIKYQFNLIDMIRNLKFKLHLNPNVLMQFNI